MKNYLIIVLAGLILTGCASAKMLCREMPTEESKSAIIKQGHVFNKKSITGKGCEIIVYGDIDAEITLKDGTIFKIKTIKPSMFERMFGWMYILKPNNVGVGK